MRSLKENTEEEKKRRGQKENTGDLQHYSSSDRKSPGGRLRMSRWRSRTEKWCHERQEWSFKEVVIHRFGEKLYLRGRKKNKSQRDNI